MSQEPVIRIWEGSSSFQSGSTPFGYYDSDTAFLADVDRTAQWCARRLGYPILDVELQSENFYAAFEEAISEYSRFVNMFNARDNLLNLTGLPTGSMELSGQYIQPNLYGVFQLSKQYGSEVGAGGLLTYYTGSVNLTEDRQVYDLDVSGSVNLEKGDFTTDNFTIRRIFHGGDTPYLNEYSEDNMQYILDEFGWGDMGVTNSYTLMPLHYDALRLQAIEMNNQIRRSAHTFQLTANRLRVFPIPRYERKLYFTYTLNDELIIENQSGSGSGVITDISNIPYGNLTYSLINDMGRNWIKRYTLAITKEMLGLVRSKYAAIPIPDNEISLNGTDLLSQAATEMENLVTELKETLESMSRQAQLERGQAEV